MRRIGATIAFVLLAMTAASVPAGAEEGDSEQPGGVTVGVRTADPAGGDDRGRYEYEVLPKGVVQDYIAVSNFRRRPVTVRVFAKDAASSPGSPFAVQESRETPHDVGSWIALKKDRLRLPPQSETVIPFQLGVPANATPGDHAGAIVVSLLAREPKPEGGHVIVDHRVGLRVYLRVPGELAPELRVSGLEVAWDGERDVLGRGDVTVTYTVRNTGNVRLSTDQDLALSRSLGLPGLEASGEPIKEILPGGELAFQRTFSNVVGTGPMRATVTLHPRALDDSFPEPLDEVEESVSFSAYPWQVMAEIALLLLLLLGAAGYYRRRRRLRAAPASADAEAPPAGEKGLADALARSVLLSVLAGLALGLAPGSAQAAEVDQWRARTSIKEGTNLQPFDILTSGGCPSPATNIVGFAFGAGFPKEGSVVIGNNDAGVQNGGPFVAAPADTMQGLMALQPEPEPLHGVYKLVVHCIEPEFDRSYGDYVLAIKFDTPTHWALQPPLSTKRGPNVGTAPPPGETDEPGSGESPGDAQPGTGGSGDSAAGGGPGEGETSAGQAAEEQAAAERAAELSGTGAGASNEADQGSVSWPLLAAGLGVLGAVGLLLTRRGRSTT